jgi:hypothetical protein
LKRIIFIILGVIHVLVAISSIPADYSLILQSDRRLVDIIADKLVNALINDLFLPGSLLFVFIGLLNLINSFFCFIKSAHAPVFGLLVGELLILWIILQVSFFGLNDLQQPAFLVIGLIEILLSLHLFKLIDKENII